MTTSATTTGSKVGRARRQFSQLWQVPLFLFGLLAFLGAAASAPWRHPPQWWEFDSRLKTLRYGLEQNHAIDGLSPLADEINTGLATFPDRAAEGHFLIGSVYYRQARKQSPALAREFWPRALQHLENISEANLKESDRLAYKYRLGYCLYQQKKDLARALELMTLSAEKAAEQPVDGYRALLDANLALTPANVDGALAASRRILDLTPDREVDALAQARLRHGELLLRKQAKAEALKELERIPASAPRGVRVKARLLQARICEDEGQWTKATTLWQELLEDAAVVDGGQARIYYAMGWCYHHMEPPSHDDTIRVWSEAVKLTGPEAQAAGLHLGALRLSLGNQQAAQALADWQQALAAVTSPADFKNPNVELAEVYKLFESAMTRFAEAQDPEKTQLVAELYRKIAPSGIADQRLAKAAEDLADQWQDKLTNLSAGITKEMVQAQFRRAADFHERSARTLPAEQRPESLWRSVQCWLAAKDSEAAQRILLEHVKIEKKEARLAEAWFTLGDLSRAQGDKTRAHEAFVKCIEIPDTPFASRSRYHLALEEIDRKAFDKAYVILKQNLQDDTPSFDRPAHEKSLYKMAVLVLMMGKYEEASVYLKECQRLYPENPQALHSRDQLGECYRQLAKKETLNEKQILVKVNAETSGKRRQMYMENLRAHRQSRLRWLTSAVKTYQDLADELARKGGQKALSPLEEILLRRAWFGIGECHLDNDEIPEAMRVFGEVQSKHRQTMESFFASLRICKMVEVLQARQVGTQELDTARAKARVSLGLVEEDLKAMPADHEVFRRPDAPPRDEWLNWHQTMQRTLLAPPKNEGPLPFIR